MLRVVPLVVVTLAATIALLAGWPDLAYAPGPVVAPQATPPAITPSPTATTPTAERARPTVEGMRIRIARLGIDLPILEGDITRDVGQDGRAGSTPEGAAFHFPGTAVPGEVGNAYLYAHARRGMFLEMWRASVGDEIVVRLADGAELRYRVTELHERVAYTDTSWLQPTADERLTLQTSTGPAPADPRFIVVARRVL